MFNKFFTVTLFAFIVASCKPVPNTGADGYQFGTPQYEKQQVLVNVVTYNTQKELLASAKAKGVNDTEIVAFSELRAPFDVCTIHMVKPTVKYEPEFVGHEFLHCSYGQWHTSNQSRS
jgi:hypothetical protein